MSSHVLATIAESNGPSWVIWATLLFCLLVLTIVHVAFRNSHDHLPDDTALQRRWDAASFTHETEPPPPLLAAAQRVRRTSAGGGNVLGLPSGSGIRLAASAVVNEFTVWVGDLWDVTSVSSTNDAVTSATVRIRAVAAIDLGRPSPKLIIGQESALSGMLSAGGMRDLQFEGDAFNRAWRVRSDEERWARGVVTARVMAALEDAGPQFALEFAGGLLTIHETRDGGKPGGQLLAFETISKLASRLAEVMDPDSWPTASTLLSAPTTGSTAFDPRPPGADHPRPARKDRIISRAVGYGVPGGMAAFIGWVLICDLLNQ